MYETLFEPLNSFRKDRNHVNKIFSSYLCLIRKSMSYSHDFKFFERLNGAKSVLFIWFEKHKNLSQEKCLILWRPPSFKITNQGYSGICFYRKFLYHCNYFHMVGYHSTLQCSDEYICMSYLNQGFKIGRNFWLI